MKIATTENVTVFIKDKDYVIKINDKELESFKNGAPYYFTLCSRKEEYNKYILNFADETKNFLEIKEQSKSNTKKRFKLIVGLISVVLILFVGFIIYNRQTDYSNKFNEINKENKAYKEIIQGNYDIGIELLKDTNITREELANVYFIVGQFDNAIANNPSLAKIIIEKFYTDKTPTKILELNSRVKYVQDEQDIIKYDYKTALLLKDTLINKEQLKRLAFSFLEHQSLTDASDINLKLKDKDIETAINGKELELSNK